MDRDPSPSLQDGVVPGRGRLAQASPEKPCAHEPFLSPQPLPFAFPSRLMASGRHAAAAAVAGTVIWARGD